MNYNKPDLLDALAAQYVLGTLTGAARRRFTRLLRQLPAACDAVDFWQARLHSLAVSLPPVTPPANIWAQIERRLPGAPSTAKSSWGWLRPALGLACGVLLGVALMRQVPQHFVSLDQLAEHEQRLPASYVGILTDEQGRSRLLVSSTRLGTRVTLRAWKPIAHPPGKVLRLWALPQDDSGAELAPIALGDISGEGLSELAISAPAEVTFKNVRHLAVSLEDAGSQSSTPAAYILKGNCARLW